MPDAILQVFCGYCRCGACVWAAWDIPGALDVSGPRIGDLLRRGGRVVLEPGPVRLEGCRCEEKHGA